MKNPQMRRGATPNNREAMVRMPDGKYRWVSRKEALRLAMAGEAVIVESGYERAVTGPEENRK